MCTQRPKSLPISFLCSLKEKDGKSKIQFFFRVSNGIHLGLWLVEIWEDPESVWDGIVGVMAESPYPTKTATVQHQRVKTKVFNWNAVEN